jgi:hypothetical protein
MERDSMSQVTFISNLFKLSILFFLLFGVIYFTEGWTFLDVNEKTFDLGMLGFIGFLIFLCLVMFGLIFYSYFKEKKQIELEYGSKNKNK